MCSKNCNTKAVPNAVKDMAEMGGAVSVSVTSRASVKLGLLSERVRRRVSNGSMQRPVKKRRQRQQSCQVEYALPKTT